MKLDTSKKMTISTKRTLKLLTASLTRLLEKKPFEKITVIDICDESLIPRATFYNYFEDKFDLLNYYWQECGIAIQPETAIDPTQLAEYMVLMIDNLIRYMQHHFESAKSICTMNANGQLFLSLRLYVAARFQESLLAIPEDERELPMPVALESDLLAGSIITISVWWINHSSELSRERIHAYCLRMADRYIPRESSE